MSSPTQDLWVRPLFYDALSGEFYPLCDPEQRAHALGRLAYASFEKGSRSYDTSAGFGSIRGKQLKYRPSWSPDVEATVSCRMLGERPTLAGISLRAAEHLFVVSEGGEQAQCELVNIEDENYRLPLNLAEINDTRNFITQAAAQFFEQVK